ncbi:MAG TPA: ATP-binding cassette domain-containing protein [Deltaproteobacteria bacterium]|nr:ATP-binding cassette domain-containing protein [Deltaproteobacteria bacterium]
MRIEELRKSFGDLVVLDGVSLDILQGKTTAILGPSGCGKSVLLKHIVGLLRPDSGHVWIDGIDMAIATPEEKLQVRKRFGMLFQHGALFEDLTAGENIAFPLRYHTRLTAAQRRARAQEVLELVEMPELHDRPTSALSGGQRKRVALARAIVLEPQVVLFDEPNSGLDPMTSTTIDDLILRMKERLGITFVVITHDIVQAVRISDWVGMLWQGRLVAYAPLPVFLHSEHPIVRRFLSRTL